jgi:hypothetical protein
MPATSFGEQPVGDAVQPCPLQPTHWVEIELRDDDGNPVPNEEYLVTLPDGDEVRGYLDDNGWARFAPLDSAGQCKVSFPNIDSKAWKFDSSDGPR